MLRAANISNVSARGETASSPRSRTIFRTRSASGVPPGSRVTRAAIPRAASHSLTCWATVDLPAPSMPSRVMKRPLVGDFAMSSRLGLSLLRLVLLGSQVFEIAFHGRIMLFEGLGEMVPTVAGGRGYKIDLTGFLGLHSRQQRLAARQRDRGRGQPRPSIRVVRRVGREVPGPDIAVVARPQTIDHGRICLESHPFTQSGDEYAGALRALRGQAGLLLDDGSENQGLVRSLQ